MYFEGEKQWSMVKRFNVETSTLDEKFDFLTDHKDTKLYFATSSPTPLINYSIKQNKTKVETELNIEEFVTIKGWKALGNKLGEFKIIKTEDLSIPPKIEKEIITEDNIIDSKEVKPETKKENKPEKKAEKKVSKPNITDKTSKKKKPEIKDNTLNFGDTIEFDL